MDTVTRMYSSGVAPRKRKRGGQCSDVCRERRHVHHEKQSGMSTLKVASDN